MCTVDTDVVVLAVMVAATLPADMEAFGAGKHLRYIIANQVEACLRSEKSGLQCNALCKCEGECPAS